ncbi:CpsD/CapB family tyrosine-protein kinase [Dokdonella sp.]|uniref:CpsD/CapB family tyrosine-protein kinase n=1 Tax=Dokdonella sp. TaxID=2291710 RepID=UPI003526D7D1
MSNPDSSDNTMPDHVGKALGAAAGDMARRAGATRSIARIVEPNALAPVALEERRLIHREESVRRQADAFREIRTRLLALGGEHNFVTMVAPISPRSGGSFVARNLAAAFAFDEAKTALLVDCNLRHPSQHTELRVDPVNGGLIDYLDHPSLGVEKILYHTGIPRLRLIPCGRQREMGGEYFSSFRMRAMLDSLRSRYADRYIFLDGPAVKGSPDARILADLVDFVVLVAGSGRDTPASIQKVVANFDSTKLAGIVLNELP